MDARCDSKAYFRIVGSNSHDNLTFGSGNLVGNCILVKENNTDGEFKVELDIRDADSVVVCVDAEGMVALINARFSVCHGTNIAIYRPGNKILEFIPHDLILRLGVFGVSIEELV